MEYIVGAMAGKIVTDYFKMDCTKISKAHTEQLNKIKSKYINELDKLSSAHFEKLQHQ